jgi:hypothetical protein
MIYDDDMFVLEMDFLDMRICDVDACREDQKIMRGSCLRVFSVSHQLWNPLVFTSKLLRFIDLHLLKVVLI